MGITGTEVDIDEEELEVFRDEVRISLRDFAGMNIILDDVEFTDEDIELAIKRAVRRINAMTPITNFSWRSVPEAILFLGTTRYLMQSESFLQLRNEMRVQSDGMGAVGIDAKFQKYKQAEQTLAQEFLEAARNFKNQVNMNSGFGNLHSGYQHVSRFSN